MEARGGGYEESSSQHRMGDRHHRMPVDRDLAHGHVLDLQRRGSTRLQDQLDTCHIRLKVALLSGLFQSLNTALN